MKRRLRKLHTGLTKLFGSLGAKVLALEVMMGGFHFLWAAFGFWFILGLIALELVLGSTSLLMAEKELEI